MIGRLGVTIAPMTFRVTTFLFFLPIAATLLYPELALAQSRGGSCRSSFCQFTGGVVMLILIGAFFLTLAESIRRHGFWRGIFRHAGVQALFWYVLLVGSAIFLVLAAYELGGKNAAIALCLASIVVLYFFVLPRLEKKRDE